MSPAKRNKMKPKLMFWFFVVLSIISVPIWVSMMILTVIMHPFIILWELFWEAIASQKSQVSEAIRRGTKNKLSMKQVIDEAIRKGTQK
jgi:hypothetical protein